MSKPSFIRTNFVVMKYVLKFCPKFILFAIVHIIASVAKTFSKVLLISKAIEVVIKTQSIDDVYKLLSSLLIYVIVIIVCSLINGFYENYISQRYQIIYQKNIQRFLYSKVKIIDMESYDDPAFYDRFTRGCRESSWRGFMTFRQIISFIIHILSAIALGTYIVLSDNLLILIIILSSIISMITLTIVRKMYYKVYKDTENERRYQMYVNRTFYNQNNAAELKTTNIDSLLVKKFKENTKSIDKKFIKTSYKMCLPESIGLISRTLLNQAGTYIVLLYRLFKGILNIASFTTLINATVQFSSSFEQAVTLYTQLRENLLYMEDMLWALDYTPVIEKDKEEVEGLEYFKLNINNVEFNYPKANYNAIDNLTLEIKKGQRIAIVGDNGSGKTTLMKLLLSFYAPTKGDISINDIPYSTLSTKQIRSKYSIVFQDFQIYAVTIAENVLMRRLKSKEDEELVWNALKNVGLYEKIKSFEKGIHTLVTREFDRSGVSFSGGERQRLAIARVFASNKDIYILDEPTSSLDPLAEERINKLIISNAQDKTMIIIAHRLSTVVDADIIYLFRDGKIIEKGTHKELMELNGRYAYMFNIQKHLYEVKE